jgi:hypothetical protein
VLAAIDIRYELPNQFLDTTAQRNGFICLGAFLIAFLFIRTSARLTRSVSWWPGGVVTDEGVHLHHLVWGICLLLISGFLGFALDPGSPWEEVFAAAFGVGAGFTLDEFALWVQLKDVYWTEEGRSSLDAVVIATVFAALVVFGIAPFDLSNSSPGASLVVTVVVELALCLIVILKGKFLLAGVGLFIPPLSVIGAVRLAMPNSIWAHHLYRKDGRKLERSKGRHARVEKRRRRLLNAIGGAPSSTHEGDAGRHRAM